MTTKKTTHKESTANKSAKVAKVAPAVIAQAEQVAPAQVNTIQLALKARFALIVAHCDSTAVQSQTAKLHTAIKKMTDNVMSHAQKTLDQTNFDQVAKSISDFNVTTKQGVEQVKTICRIVDVIVKIAQGIPAEHNIFNDAVRAMLKNQNKASIAEMVIANSKSARETSAFKIRESFTCRSGSYTIGTSKAQVSSARQVMRIMGFATVIKGKREDVAELNAYGIKMLQRAYS
jgi:hypothetical protein